MQAQVDRTKYRKIQRPFPPTLRAGSPDLATAVRPKSYSVWGFGQLKHLWVIGCNRVHAPGVLCQEGLPCLPQRFVADQMRDFIRLTHFYTKHYTSFWLCVSCRVVEGRCQKDWPWDTSLPQTFAVRTEACFGHFWARKSPGCCSSRQGFLAIAAILSGKGAFLDKNRPPDEEGRL